MSKKIFMKVPYYTDNKGVWTPMVDVKVVAEWLNLMKSATGDEYKLIATPFDYVVVDENEKVVVEFK
jgi:hypothetical protein